MKKGMTQVLVTVIIALIVVSVIGGWAAVRTKDILDDINNTVPRIDYARQEFRELEQVYSGSTSMFFSGWKTNLPQGTDACFQPLPQFGDFFRYYDLNLILTAGDNNKKTVYFRVADIDNNRVATNSFDTEKSLCIIDYSKGQFIKDAPKITFSSLTMTKNINLLREDKFLIKIPEKDYEKEFGTSSLEYFPLMYVDNTHTCFVIGAQEGFTNLGTLPICDDFSLSEVADMVSADLNSCLESEDENCGCSVNIPNTKLSGYEIGMEFVNEPGKVNIIFNNGIDTLSRSFDFVIDVGGMEEFHVADGKRSSVYDDTYEWFYRYINHFPIMASYSTSSNKIRSFFDEKDFNEDFDIESKIYFLKPSPDMATGSWNVNENDLKEGATHYKTDNIWVFNGREYQSNSWPVLRVINNLNRVELCK